MPLLQIIPYGYSSSRLDELAEGVMEAFAPRFREYRIFEDRGFDEIANKIFDIPDDTTASLNVGIPGLWFYDYLRRYIQRGTVTLALTSLSMMLNSQENYVCGYGMDNIAVVSSGWKSIGIKDTDSHIKIMTMLSTHEIGHALGAEKHHLYGKTRNGLYCPLSTFGKWLSSKETKYELIPKNEIYHNLDSKALCEPCYKKLRI
jgi:hypothetical protein